MVEREPHDVPLPPGLDPRAGTRTDTDTGQDAPPRTHTAAGVVGRLARVGGWSFDVASDELTWSGELLELLEVEDTATPGIEATTALLADPEEVVTAIQRCLAQGTPFELEVDVVTQRRHPLRARIAGEAQRDGRGRIVGVVGIFQDVTARYEASIRANALARRLEASFESMTDALYLLDVRWRFAYVNAHAERLLDRTRQQLIGEVVWEAFPGTVGSELDATYGRAVATGATQRLHGWYYPPLDTWFDVTAYPSEAGLAVYFSDAGERMHRERRLERLAAEEQAAADRLREVDRLKDAFLAAVSHELRTPLTVVQGMGRTLQRLRGALGTDRRNELEDALVDHADQLGKLLDDLLDLDRLSSGAGQVQLERCDAAGIVRQVLSERLHGAALPAATAVDLPSRLEATVDPVQLQRITASLVDNAVKYAPPGPTRVSLRRLAPDGLVLEVVDDGPGIEPAVRDEVFRPLYRADERHPRPGTGIGLALVAAFAQLHGGSAEVLDSPQGAHLRVWLPGRSPLPFRRG